MSITARCAGAVHAVGPEFPRWQFALDILSKGPNEVVRKSEYDPSICTSSKGDQIENDAADEADKGEPPAKDKSPENVADGEV